MVELTSLITFAVLITNAYCVPKILINKKVKLRQQFLYNMLSY